MSNSPPKHPIYIVDDEKKLLESLFITLRTAGFDDVSTFNDPQDVLRLLPNLECALVLLDLCMPGVFGGELLELIKVDCPHVAVVIVTGLDETETAVRCMRAGAFDYLVKPVEPDRLITTVRRALSHALLIRQNFRLRQKLLSGRLDHPKAFAEIITADQKMQSIFRYLEVIASASDPVLITGETGTGKDLLAAALHRVSGRSGPFVSLNAAGLDENMFADTLFGHVKGAFTDAGSFRTGLVEQAQNGTLFLDEIGDLPWASQIKLLKLIQDREYYPLGADRPCRGKARIVVATNQDLEARQQQGLFRKDLFYRINTYHVHLPPLRDRSGDIALLAEHYLEKACVELDRQAEPFRPRLASMLQAYAFPGNVRELRALVFDAMASGGLACLEEKLAARGAAAPSDPAVPLSVQPSPQILDPMPGSLPTLERAVQDLVREALRRSRGNQAAAARMLGISRQALNKRISRMERPE